MQRLTLTWTSNGAAPNLDLDLTGFARIPAPNFASFTLLNLNIPFDMHVLECGLFLVSIEGFTPHVAFVNGARHNYTWALPFEPQSLTGNYSWFCQLADDERFSMKSQFLDRLRMNVRLITQTSDLDFPATPAGRFCSLELQVKCS